ncbi:MAG: hypothetical protein IPL64_12060 [Flavobacteriales bacterium]|nr:hypothetical protein [Flavobacteriales bacterium]
MAKVLRGIIKVSQVVVGQFLIASLSGYSWCASLPCSERWPLADIWWRCGCVIVAMLPAWGMANAAATLVGQNLGAEQPDRAARSAWWCGHYNMVYMVLVTVLFWSAAPWIVSFFDQGPAADGYAILALRVISLGYFFYGYGMVLAQALNGAGDSLTPTWLNVIRFWIVEIPWPISSHWSWPGDR